MTKYLLLKNKKTGVRSIYNTETKEKTLESENPILYSELRKKALVNLNKRAKHEALISLGLKRVKGSLGGVYYE